MTESRESCPGCGFVWDDIGIADVTQRVQSAAERFSGLLGGDHQVVTTRPTPDRWSVLEYAAHLRDVLLLLRDRIILSCVEETPTPFPLYRDDRVRLGLYAAEQPSVVASDLQFAASVLGRAFDALAPEHSQRTMIYGFPMSMERTIAWTGAQCVHESEHHLADAEDNLARLG